MKVNELEEIVVTGYGIKAPGVVDSESFLNVLENGICTQSILENGTPLSAQEVAQGYKDVKERSAVVRFKCVDEDAYILAWTTTPWTLPSNVALCMHPEYEYVKVKSNADGKVYYMAQALVEKILGEDVEILETYKGKDLEHKAYEPLFPYADEIIKRQNKS